VRVADVLDVESKDLTEKLRQGPDDPQVEIEGRFRLGRSFLALGLIEEAVANLDRAYARSRQVRGEDDELTLRIASRLVHAQRVPRGRGGEPLARAAHAAALGRYGPDHPRTLAAACDLADTLCQYNPAGAAPIYREVLQHARQDPGATPIQLAAILNNYAWVLYFGGHFEEAEVAAREAYQRSWSPGVGQVLPEVRGEAINILTQILNATGQHAEAIQLFRRNLNDVRARSRATHPLIQVVANQFADLLVREGMLDEALQVRRDLLEANLARAGAREWDDGVAACRAAVADVLYRKGELAAAAEAWEQAARMKGRDDPSGEWWHRNGVLASHLGTAGGWRSEAIRGQVWCALDELLKNRGAAPSGTGDLAWEKLRFRLERVVGKDGTPNESVATTGGLSDLKAMRDPEPGVYVLSIELPRRAGESKRGRAAVLFCPWDVSVYIPPIAIGPPPNDVWQGATARVPAEHRTVGALAYCSAMAGQSGTIRRTNSVGGFGLVATAELKLPAGDYRFLVTCDDGARLFVDDGLVIDDWTTHAPATAAARVKLSGGTHSLRVEFFQNEGGFMLWPRVDCEGSPGTAAAEGSGVEAVRTPSLVARPK
jgi:tetratricopeptide (TPR) repeat protein